MSDYHNFYEFIASKQVELQNIRRARDAEQIINSPPLQHIKTETFEEETITEVTNLIFVETAPQTETPTARVHHDDNDRLIIRLSTKKEHLEAMQNEQLQNETELDTLDGMAKAIDDVEE